MDFAILENSIVKYIVGIFPSNWHQFEEVVVCNRNVQVGDSYVMGIFYHEGNRVLSPEEVEYQQVQDIITKGVSA